MIRWDHSHDDKTSIRGSGSLTLTAVPKMVLRSGLPPDALQRELLSVQRGSDVGHRALAFYLWEVASRRVFQLWGFSSVEQFAEARLDMGRRMARELVRVGRDLDQLPVLDSAFREGRLSWSKVRLLLRVVEVETEAEWVKLAESLNVRDLDARVSQARKGDRAHQNDGKGIGEVTLRFVAKVRALTHAMGEKAREKVAAVLGEEEVSDDLLLSSVFGAFLEGEVASGAGDLSRGEAGPFHVLAHRSADGGVLVETADGPVPVSNAVGEMMICDAGVHGDTTCPAHPSDTVAPLLFGQDVPTPKALRNRVLARDGYRCRWCRSTVNLHVHHIQFRSAGGPTVARNLTAVCLRCHTLIHEGLLKIRGVAPHNLSFADARGDNPERWEPGRYEVALDVCEPEDPRPSALALAGPVLTVHEKTVTLDDLPLEVPSVWWGMHQHLMTWNDRRGVLEWQSGPALLSAPPKPDQALTQRSGITALQELVGQSRVVRALQVAANAARLENRPVAHTLLRGPAGCGKSTLALALGKTCGVTTRMTSGPALTSTATLVGLVTGLLEKDILFIDEIHGLPRPVMEMLYELMEGGRLSLPIAEGTKTRTITIRLPAVTVMGATTEPHLLPAPLLSRFGLDEVVARYTDDDLAIILTRTATARGYGIETHAAQILARASLGSPRRAKALLGRARDHGLDVAHVCQEVTASHASAALAAAGLDSQGLGPEHRDALNILTSRGRPLGVSRLAGLLGLTARAFRATLEPDLLRLGLVSPTPKGLVASA